MGEITTPGCLSGSSGLAADSPIGCGADAPARRGATATGAALRATRTRAPSCSISISVRPVSSRELGELMDQFVIDRGAFGAFAMPRAPLTSLCGFGADQAGQAR